MNNIFQGDFVHVLLLPPPSQERLLAWGRQLFQELLGLNSSNDSYVTISVILIILIFSKKLNIIRPGHEEDMDTGGQDQVIFDMDQGYNQSYTQDQVDEMNQQLNQTRSVFLSTLQGK